MSKKNVILLLLSTVLLLVSCGKDKFNYEKNDREQPLQKEEGTVEFLLSAVDRPALVKADASNLDVNDFTIEIYNSAGVRVKKWDKYSQMKDTKIRFNVGNYRLKAYYGDSSATGFDALYFAGSNYFTVEGQKSKQLSVICKMANVKVKIKWGDILTNMYSDYNVKVYRAQFKDTLFFAKDETRSAYIPAGTLRFKIYLKDKSGVERVYIANPLDCAPNDYVTVQINSAGEASYEISTKFSINTETDDKEKDYIIPGLMRPRGAPSVSTTLPDNSTPVEFIEGVGSNVKFNLTASGSIESAVMKVESPILIDRGWPSQIDFATLSFKDSEILKRDGVVWTSDMQYKKDAVIDLSGVSKLLASSEGGEISKVSLIVKDVYGQQSSEKSMSFKAIKANLSISPLNTYDMWSKFAYMGISTNVPIDSIRIERDNGSGWASTNFTVESKDENKYVLKINALSPATTYNFRANYKSWNIVTDIVSSSTEAAQALENGNMETWTSTKLYGGNGTFSGAIYCDYVSSWSTRNEKTTNGADGASGIGNYGVNWRWCSGTVSTEDKTEGTKAAEISTLAFYNKSVGGSWSRDEVYSYTRDNGTAYIGYLFTGTFDKEMDKYKLGIAHDSRPVSISFDFKYAACTGGDNCLIYAKLYDSLGNEIASTGDYNSSGQADYVNRKLAFNYTNKKVKAASIVVFFQSGYQTNIANMTRVSGSYSLTPFVRDRIVGSVLKVDNVILNY